MVGGPDAEPGRQRQQGEGHRIVGRERAKVLGGADPGEQGGSEGRGGPAEYPLGNAMQEHRRHEHETEGTRASRSQTADRVGSRA
jgi:hypothetical protein